MNNNTRFTPLHRQVLTEIRERNLWADGQSCVVAVSGGQDSLCLLKLLLDLQKQEDWNFYVAHLDHGWRADSAQTAEVVADLARTWGLPFYLHRAVTPLATEAAARDWRYAWLGNLAQTLKAPVVLTGHTATDRAETVLFNLFRGAGLAGLGSLDWQRPLTQGVRLVRPLLRVSRTETATFCEAYALPVQVDPTNEDLRYSRNRLRLELMPYLATHFNPQIVRQLAQSAEVFAAEEDYLAALAQAEFQQLYQKGRIQRLGLIKLPLALQRRVIQLFLREQGTQGFSQVEAVRQLLHAPSGSRTSSLHQGQGVEVQGDELVWG